MNQVTEITILDIIKKQEFPTQASIANSLKINKTIICVLVNSMIQRKLIEQTTVGKCKILKVRK